jgi:hypothetical protein
MAAAAVLADNRLKASGEVLAALSQLHAALETLAEPMIQPWTRTFDTHRHLHMVLPVTDMTMTVAQTRGKAEWHFDMAFYGPVD